MVHVCLCMWIATFSLFSEPLTLSPYKRLEPVGIFLKWNGTELSKKGTWRRPASQLLTEYLRVQQNDDVAVLLCKVFNLQRVEINGCSLLSSTDSAQQWTNIGKISFAALLILHNVIPTTGAWWVWSDLIKWKDSVHFHLFLTKELLYIFL